jgi:hypothetical protein
MTPHDDHEERALRAALRTLVPPSIARGDWQDVLRRAADLTHERPVASVEWRRRRVRSRCAAGQALGWGTRAL